MKNLVLYSSKDCCLCDDAMSLLQPCLEGGHCTVDKKDIYQDKGLLIKYRYSIPVLQHLDSGAELSWPFNADDLQRWLAEQPKSNG